MQPMAKARKRTTVADSKPLQSTPDDWMPLTDAFQHIQQVVGGEQLAEEDLRLRLESGDVEAQERRVTPGGGIDILPLTPEDFKDGLLFPRLPEHIGSLHREAHLRDNLLRRVDRYRSAGRNFFLRRTDVYRIWPIVGERREAAEGGAADDVAQGYRPEGMARHQEVLQAVGARVAMDQYREGPAQPRSASALAMTDGERRDLGEALAYLRQKGLIDR